MFLSNDYMLKWNENIAIGKDKKNSFTFYDVQENGDLWLSGDKWGKKYDKKGIINYPNRICKFGSKQKAILVAETLNTLENS